MTKQTINLGTADKGDGDPLRTAFNKVNENFTELYNALGLDAGGLNLGSFQFDGNVMSTTDSSNIIIDQAVTVESDLTVGGNLFPNTANGGDLGSPSKPWNSLYVSNNTIYIGGVPLSLDADNNLLINNSSISSEIEYASIPNAPTDISDLTDDGGLLGGGSSLTVGNGTSTSIENVTEILINGTITEIEPGIVGITINGGGGLTSSNDIDITINNDDSSSYTWNYGNTGTLTLPNGQQIDAEDPNLLQIGSADAGVRLNRLNQSTLLIAKKSFNRNFGDGGDWTITATAGPPHIVTVTFSPNVGLYFRQLLERLQIKLNFGGTDFIYDYSNVQINLNPEDQAVVANITSVSQTNYDPLTYEITIDEDPTAVVGVLTDITISYDYNNTVGLDVEEDRFGIATDNDDIDIRSGRDIDLIAADDIFIQAGSLLEITLNQNDGQEDTDGIEISTITGVSNNVWRFGFDGDLDLPQDGGIVFDRNNTTIRVGMGFHIASGEGISLDAIDQNAILTLSGAGNGPVNQTYNKTNDTLYTGNDNSSVTVENLGGTWFVFIDGDAKYTSNDLIGWALSTGPGPVPVGGLSNGYKSWGFSPTGTLTLPPGGVITNADGFTLNAGGHGTITIGTFIETPGVDEHFHIAFPSSNTEVPYQDLYLGDDFNFVKVRGSHNAIDHGVDIGANNRDGGSQHIWNFGTDGTITLPGGGSVDGSDLDVEITAGNDGASTFGSVTINTQAPPAVYTVVQQSSPVGFDAVYTTIIETPYIASIVPGMIVTGSGITTPTTVASVTGPDEFGTYTINLTPTVGAELSYLETYTFTSGGVTNRIWDFNSLGELYLPQGGAIQETEVTNELWGTTTTSLTLVPAGANNGTQRLEIYSTGGGEGDHIHITSGDQNVTDVFLGNDTQYFAVGAMGQNEIRARRGADSPSPGTPAYAGSPVFIYAGDAGDNGGNTADGAPGGEIFLQAGASTDGLGGEIILASGNGPTGRGSIKLSTDGGSSHLEFDNSGTLTFPGGMTIETEYGGGARLVIDGKENYVDIRSDGNILIGYNESGGTVVIGNGTSGQVDILGPKFRVTATVPTSSTGADGDMVGMIAVGGGYLYVCTANWVSPGSANIWTRTLLTTGAW
jgi:hypothetical protein